MEQHLLRLILSFKFYNDIKSQIPRTVFSKEILELYDIICNTHEKLQKDLSLVELKQLFRANYPVATKAKLDNIDFILDNLPEDVSESVAKEVLKKVWITEAGRQIAQIGIDIVNGKAPKIEETRKILEEIENGRTDSVESLELISDGLEEILKAVSVTTKWSYNIPDLAKTAIGVGPGIFLAAFGRVEVGKCLGVDTPILMYDGTLKKVQDISINDKVMGPDNESRTVLQLATGEEELFKITYSFGESYVVNGSHILSLKKSGAKIIQNVSVRNYLNWPRAKREVFKGWKIRGVRFLNYLDYGIIEPYLLGVWLGDGSSKGPQITNIDDEVIEYLENLAYKNNWSITVSNGITYILSDPIPNKHGSFGKALKRLKLIKNKHIPQNYKTGSRQTRLQVLAGLIDTDGHKNISCNSYEITQKNKILADDIVFLARSLGFHVTIKSSFKRATNSKLKIKREYWRINIFDSLHTIPVRIERKKYIVSTVKPKRSGLNFGISVASIGIGRYYGFTLDGDGLFVLGDFTVTHNSAFGVSLAATPGGFCDQGATVHFYANEEGAIRTKARAVMAYTGMPLTALSLNIEEAKAQYSKIDNLLKFYDCRGKNIIDIEGHIKRNKPDIVIVDQLDKLGVIGNYAREDERLGELYVRFRDILNRYNCAGLALSQANADAEGKAILNATNMALARTSKAAECDVLIGIGKSNLHSDNVRILSLIKNKVNSDHNDVICMIQPELSRYVG